VSKHTNGVAEHLCCESLHMYQSLHGSMSPCAICVWKVCAACTVALLLCVGALLLHRTAFSC
jgi:hypothetical protein